MMDEFDFIRRYLYHRQSGCQVLVGIGDDAAVIRPQPGYDLCFSSDMLLKGRHFFADVAPDDLAWKVLAVNISDMAAMGARPRWVLLSAGLPRLSEAWLERFCDTFFTLAGQYGIELVGGDTVKGDLVFNVTIIGELPAGCALRRDKAQEGDDIWLSGRIGLAAAALNHRLGNIVLPYNLLPQCDEALLRPQPRVALGQALLPLAHAAMDVSDGLIQDLGHILTASGAGAEIEAAALPTLPGLFDVLPDKTVWQYLLAGGDDYELLFTAPQHQRAQIGAAAAACGTPVSRIGVINASGRLKISDGKGGEMVSDTQGFNHFG